MVKDLIFFRWVVILRREICTAGSSKLAKWWLSLGCLNWSEELRNKHHVDFVGGKKVTLQPHV